MKPSSQAVLAAIAMLLLGALGGALVFLTVPSSNATILGMIVGALAGALTVGGNPNKIADKVTTSNGPDATIQPEESK